MIFISKFRSNDLNSSKGKQIEFNPTICKDFFGFTEPNVYTEFECRSLTNSSIVQNIKVSFTLSPARGDYKVYNNSDGSNLKDFFLNTLGLTEDNSNDYFAIKKKSNGKYVLFYIPDSELIRGLFAFTKSDIITINNHELLGELNNITPRQVIYYGAPGTGKSYKIKGLVNEGNHVRTTFHPDSDYASFVGAYKPTMIEISSRDMAGHVILDKGNEVKEKKIVYEFVAQSFLQAYTEAWKRSVCIMTDKEGKNTLMPEEMDDKYYLVIEEINRGNCAQIFGDLFQLLDRDDNGESSYAIRPDQDMKRYLAKQFKSIEGLPEAIRRGNEIKLPSNLYIFATMNTSDQSLFPIDSAFKRRWDWEYVPIDYDAMDWQFEAGGKRYLWSDFLKKINPLIYNLTQSSDKQMGYFFAKADKKIDDTQIENNLISEKIFLNKVLFYLWTDVLKDFEAGDKIFRDEEKGQMYQFCDFFPTTNGKLAEFVGKLELAVVGESIPDNSSVDDEDDTSGNNTKSSKDQSRYSVNGTGTLKKGPAAVEAMRLYVQNNPDATAADIVSAWKIPGFPLVESEESFASRLAKSNDDRLEKRTELINLTNGESIRIFKGFNPQSMQDFINALDKQDWDIIIRKV